MRMKIKIILSIVVVAIWSNIDAQSSNSRLLRRMSRQSVEELLESQIPISEAMDLAKEGNGKGFYQLAIRYAQGNELPKDDTAAYKMLRKACDVDYANAILVEGICDERNMRDGTSYSSLPSTYKYCGVSFSYGRENRREYEWLTNEVAFARVMKKYEKARDLGALAATNQIAALNKRLANFYKEEAEARAKITTAEENDRRLAAMLGENIRQQKKLPMMSRQSVEELLELQIPINEAMDLAKEGNGKGFYQLAIRYAQGNELPKDDTAAYKMLRKACDVDYANAILVEGICDERNMRDGTSYSSLPSTYKYCGVSFSYGRENRREYEWLTNEVAFARVMKKYEKARDLGALAATNQIAALNKRLANFYKEEAEARAKITTAEENDRRLAAMLGENIRQQKKLPITSAADLDWSQMIQLIDDGCNVRIEYHAPIFDNSGQIKGFSERATVSKPVCGGI